MIYVPPTLDRNNRTQVRTTSEPRASARAEYLTPPIRRQHIGQVLLCVILVLTTSACTRTKRRYKPAILVTRSDAVGYVREALEHKDADLRREAINQLGKTRHASLPGVIDAFALAARTDESESVRCAAVSVLGRQGGRKALDTCLVLLGHPTDEGNVRPAGDELRFEAVKTLHPLAESGSWDDELHRAIHDTAIRLLASDRSRDVRLCAAQLLGRYPTVESASALIAALRQNDFGVVYAAEHSLTRLTGRSHDFDHALWAQWLESTEDPFAAGEVQSERTGGQ